jgi:hypothetical protein
VTIREAIKDLMNTYVPYPPRKLQSEGYSGPITLQQYERFQHVREMLKKEGISLPMPGGNSTPVVGGPREAPGVASAVLAQPASHEAVALESRKRRQRVACRKICGGRAPWAPMLAMGYAPFRQALGLSAQAVIGIEDCDAPGA